MCGITGVIDFQRSTGGDELRATAQRMAAPLHHRGPDAHGAWADPAAGIALGHQRLAIIDLSEHGQQPMQSVCGRLTIVFNGEIYNYRQLRRDLEKLGHTFTGDSDTAVLLAALAHWGCDQALDRLNGMFAFAVWDAVDRTLTLARDRVGIKPLYYSHTDRHFLFGSELKALRACSLFDPELDRAALAQFVQHSYIPAPQTIWQTARKLPPGSMLRICVDKPEAVNPRPWWQFQHVAEKAARSVFSGSMEDAVDGLHERLADAVDLRMISDVPLGAFLSGGIDSSVVVALMQSQTSTPVRTFTIGFEEAEYNEADDAARIAAHLKTDHTEYRVSPREAREVIPRLPDLYDEPFADSSQIPTFLVAQLARRNVTVALSGDGGDELFGGYNRYRHISRIWKRIAWLPAALRRALSGLISSPAVQLVRRRRSGGDMADAVRVSDALALYTHLNRHWRRPHEVVIGSEPSGGYSRAGMGSPKTLIEGMMLLDSVTYLPDDILTKVDRATMGVSLEARVPFLDHRVIEFAWSLPAKQRYSFDKGKLPLRRLLERYVPRALFDRRKTGFGIPIDHWLRGPLADWANDLLSEQRLKEQGIFHSQPIREKWEQHKSGECDWHYLLWDILMFQAWWDVNRG